MDGREFALAIGAADCVVGEVLTRAEKIVGNIQFAKKHQPSWVIHSQQSIINSNFRHLKEGPGDSPTKHDQEPRNIVHDTMMAPAVVQGLAQSDTVSQKPSFQESFGKQSISKSKHSNHTVLSVASVKPASKEELLKRFQRLGKPDSVDVQEERLRDYKIEEENRSKLASQNKEKPPAVCKLSKGESIVFDYEGKFSKRKDNNTRNFPSKVASGGAMSQKFNKKSKSVSQQLPDANKIESKMSVRKSKETEIEESLVFFDNHNKKEEMIQSIEIRESGIRITVEGQTVAVKRDRSLTEKVENSRASQKVKTVEMRKENYESRQRFKTEAQVDSHLSSSRDLPSTKSKEKFRVGTEASNYSGFKSEKISVENYSLHKMVLENGEELDNRYVRIPSKQSGQRRIKTNLETDSLKQHSQMDNLKIREKLIGKTKEGDKLPKILNHYKQAQAHILKQLKRKHPV